MAKTSLEELMNAATSGIKAIPGGCVSVLTGKAFIISLYFPEFEARCGDTVKVSAILSAYGLTGTVNYLFQDARSGQELGKPTAAVTGSAFVESPLVLKKTKDVWDGKPDVKAKATLKNGKGVELSTATTAFNLEITRPEGYSATMRTAARSTPQWVQDKKTGVWTKTATNYSFPCGFDVLIKDGVIVVTCKIKLVPQAKLNVTAAMKSAWKSEIEGYWNGKFQAHRKQCARGAACKCAFRCCKYDIKIVCDFVDSGEHTSVDVHPGACKGPWGGFSWWYSTRWWEKRSNNVPATVRAHEFGHNMGLFDEYKGGATPPAVDPNTYVEPVTSLMNGGAEAMDYHFAEFLNWIGKETGDPYVSMKK